MSFRRKEILALLVLVLLLIAPQARGAVRKNVAISLNKKEIRDLGSSGLVLVFYLKIANTSSSPYYLAQYDYRVVVQEKDYFSLRTSLDQPILVRPAEYTLISLPVKITYALLFETVAGLADLPKASCYVTGLMLFSDGKKIKEKVPFAFSGEFPIYKDLEIEMHPLRLKDLTVGGTEFTFAFTFRNKNSFEVTLGKTSYRLDLEGRTVGEGVIGGENRIQGQGEKSFSLPLMLDFFELGRELYDALQRPSVECDFRAQADAGSLWGEVKIDLSKKGQITIERGGAELR